MTNQDILVIALFLVYYHISGLATTNILRLTAGNKLPVLSTRCYCDSCNTPIPALFQLPIISYIICQGKCQNCKAKIPLYPLFLELSILLGMCTVSALLKFTFLGIGVSFMFYELTRITMIVFKGKRESAFGKQYFIAVVSMLPFYLSALFISLLYGIV